MVIEYETGGNEQTFSVSFDNLGYWAEMRKKNVVIAVQLFVFGA